MLRIRAVEAAVFGCFVIDAGVTPIRLRSGQALPLQLDYFGANDETIFSKRGSPRSGSQNGISFNSP